MALAPAAHAGTGNYIKITNSAGIVATTCYEWLGTSGADYCHQSWPVGESRTAYFPAGATSAVVNLKLSPWGAIRDSSAVTDASKNYCFEIQGLLGSEKLVKTGC
ncbi:hypothetical protein AB0B07_21920 [Streptomyces sioyaensis]|uniref:hypothetical protein n=1 Tax=Streptomyces sioyaensis TaxID=67364 RepID=UPI0033DA0125